MSRHLFPQLAKNVEVTDLGHFITDDSWVMEQKLDGHRLFLMGGDGSKPTTMTRNGTPYTKRLPKSITDFTFPPGEYVLDGELVGDTFWAFDIIIGLPGDPVGDSREYSTEDRRLILEAFMTACPGGHPFRLVPRAKTRDEKIALAHRALNQGYEGLVMKRLGKAYRSAGRTEEWLKLKFVATVDVVVTDVRADGKDSVGYAIHEGGTLKDIGRASLIGKEKNGAINVGDVIEVRYLYVGADGRLYQPTILRKRDDKRPIDCTGDQLRHVNKSVLASL